MLGQVSVEWGALFPVPQPFTEHLTPKEPKKNIFLIPCPPGGSHTLYSWVNSVETKEEGGGTQAVHLPPSGHGLEITELQMHSFPGKW